jgi:hypothetical protein
MHVNKIEWPGAQRKAVLARLDRCGRLSLEVHSNNPNDLLGKTLGSRSIGRSLAAISPTVSENRSFMIDARHAVRRCPYARNRIAPLGVNENGSGVIKKSGERCIA